MYAAKKVPSVFKSQTETLAPDLLNCQNISEQTHKTEKLYFTQSFLEVDTH